MKRALILSLIICCALSIAAQRRITPVEKTTNTVTVVDAKTKKKMMQAFLLTDSVARDSIRQDSIAKLYPKYPILTDLTIGVNIWDPLMRIFGTKYGGAGINATLNMWNRVQPSLEIGFGMADYSPEHKNFRYQSKFALYGKIGANYNFLFKKSPDYQLLAGLRLGFSSFKYDIHATQTDNYWQHTSELSILNQKGLALWGEVVLGLKVKLFGPISAGWLARYAVPFKVNEGSQSKVWYIPGFGERNKGFSASLSIYYTIPLKKHKWPVVDPATGRPIDPATETPETKKPSETPSTTPAETPVASPAETPTEAPNVE